MTAERYHVRVTKDHLVFCSGHFISYEGDKCERLHGHNYRATVELEGGARRKLLPFRLRCSQASNQRNHR
jgi:6-pyruvoyl-tetrahydropterin synthase